MRRRRHHARHVVVQGPAQQEEEAGVQQRGRHAAAQRRRKLPGACLGERREDDGDTRGERLDERWSDTGFMWWSGVCWTEMYWHLNVYIQGGWQTLLSTAT